MTFKLKITLGNAAMSTGEDVASALRDVADKLALMEYADLAEADPYDRAGFIRDANGNTVGDWRIR